MSSDPVASEQQIPVLSSEPILQATGTFVQQPDRAPVDPKKAQEARKADLSALLALYENADANYNGIASKEVECKVIEIAQKLISLARLAKHLNSQAKDDKILAEELAVEAKAAALIYPIGAVEAAIDGLEKSRVITGDAQVQWNAAMFLWSHIENQILGATNKKRIAAAKQVQKALETAMRRISPEAVADPTHKIDQSTPGITEEEQQDVLDALHTFFIASGFEPVEDEKKKTTWKLSAKAEESSKNVFETNAGKDRARTATATWNQASRLSTLKKKRDHGDSEGPTPSRKKRKANLGEDGQNDIAPGATGDQPMDVPADQSLQISP